MFSFWAGILSGLLLIWLGFRIVMTGEFTAWGVHQNFSGYNVQTGSIFIMLGCLLVAYEVWAGLTRNPEGNKEVSLICPKCEKAYSGTKAHDQQCSACGSALEELKGFYERQDQVKQKS
jgi:hypothetical protein